MFACNKYTCMNAGHNLTAALPDFLIVGAWKAGTSSLYSMLNQHSRIYLHPKKELHFFDVDRDYEDGVNFYASYFRDTGTAKAVGEATPAYLFDPAVPGRIVETLGREVKIIAMLRNPVDRAFSQYRMLVNRGLEKRTPDEIFTFCIKRFQSQGITFEKEASYLDRGLYSRQIENYFRVFPRKQVRLFLFEDDFLKDPESMIREIQDFLEVDFENLNTTISETVANRINNEKVDQLPDTPNPVNQFLKKIIPAQTIRTLMKHKMNALNAGATLAETDWDGWRRRLTREVFYDDIKKTEALIGRDLSGWYKDFM